MSDTQRHKRRKMSDTQRHKRRKMSDGSVQERRKMSEAAQVAVTPEKMVSWTVPNRSCSAKRRKMSDTFSRGTAQDVRYPPGRAAANRR
ncbi:hypothetical protein [Deinococcus sonorensis]|uniref:Uncharacterized protein n=2 Tax=Deinococcus sonorensis TaxID=309891 RepID=A0AAU7U574_9DEIO